MDDERQLGAPVASLDDTASKRTAAPGGDPPRVRVQSLPVVELWDDRLAI
jgi:hypothetical protein